MSASILALLKQNNDFISGEQISEMLNISRTAVWKNIGKLRLQGFVIEAITNKGYCLISCPDMLFPELIETSNTLIGNKIYHYTTLESTNITAKAEAFKGAKEGSVFITEEQTAGKGRMGKEWISGKDTVCFSVLLRPMLSPAEITTLTLVAGLAVAQAIRNITSLPAMIKWPNDIIVNSKKLCGILTEMAAEAERIAFAVVGIGINVNDTAFCDELKDKATSIFLENGEAFSRVDLLKEILVQLEKYYFLFLEKGITPILSKYSALCATLEKEITAKVRGETVKGIARAISPNGSLIIETQNGEMHLSSGEVSVRGLLGYT